MMSVGSPLKPPDNDDSALWIALQSEEGGTARSRLVEKYFPFARMLAAQVFARRSMDDVGFEDYLHFAVVGLIESIDRFDVARGVPFAAYSARRIKGAVLSGIEKYSEVREQVGFRARIRRERLKSLAEKDADGGPNRDLFADMANIVVNLALGYFLEDSDIHGNTDIETRDRLFEMESLRQIRRQVSAIVELLPDRERIVIQYHYYYQMAFSDISDVLNVTKGRVSQIHKSALAQIRESLASLASCDEKY